MATKTQPGLTGAELRKLRLSKGIMAKFIAERMKVSATYLADLELERRPINHLLRQRYLKALKV